MSFPDASPEQVQAFQSRGWLAVNDALPASSLEELEGRCAQIRQHPERYGLRWDPEAGVPGYGEGRVVQSMLELVWIDWRAQPFAEWVRRFAEALLGQPLRLWYNQLLDKPPRNGAPTGWHQDGAFLGEDTGGRLISCWIPLRAVAVESGCMHFLDGGHLDGVLEHARFADRSCAFGPCEVDEDRVIAAPLPSGGVTFHHGLTPHMTQMNRSDAWRQVLILRFFAGDFPRPPQDG